jgi:dethiobiotin synthetase
MSHLFITGVGTGVGKTLVMTILCRQLRAVGAEVLPLKPVVSGFDPEDSLSDPAVLLRSVGVEPTASAIASISPWRFGAPIAPHLAARREGRSVTLEELQRFCRDRVIGTGSVRLVEGAGGVMSPLCDDATCLDLIAGLGDPAVLVTGTYLGAISHTLTALSVLRNAEIPVRGIVCSESPDSVGLAETSDALRQFGGGDVRIYPLPRLIGEVGERWQSAPPLLSLCEAEDE